MRTINRYGKYAVVEDNYVLRQGESDIVPPRQYFDKVTEEKDWEDYPAPAHRAEEPEEGDTWTVEEKYIITYKSEDAIDFLRYYLDISLEIPVVNDPSASDVEGKFVIGHCPEGARPEKQFVLKGEGVADVESATYKQLMRAGAELVEVK